MGQTLPCIRARHAVLGLVCVITLTFVYWKQLHRDPSELIYPEHRLRLLNRRSSFEPPDLFDRVSYASDIPGCHIPVVGVTTAASGVASSCINKVAEIMPVVIVGIDGGSSSDSLTRDNIDFLSPARQAAFFPALDAALPLAGFSRKSIGYLRALHMGACHIWDFVDGNILSNMTMNMLRSLHKGPLLQSTLAITSEEKIVNPYPLYGPKSFTWPRGYPAELAESRDFPRLVKKHRAAAAGTVDVVHFMQDGNPDVDSEWRQRHEHELPFNWLVNRPIATSLVTIDSSKWAPFNAEATLISSRAARFALLPHTVSDRVSDIWRSYFLQYMMKHFSGRGLVAISGAAVEHSPGRLSVEAAAEAEQQMHRQVKGFVDWLDTRPVSTDDPIQELVRLMEDACQKGYVAGADVRAAKIWVHHVRQDDPSTRMQQRDDPVVAEPVQKTVRSNAGAVLHVNHQHVEVIPTWLALHSHKFHSVFVYCPGSPSDMISGVPVRSISNDTAGIVAYGSMVDAIERLAGAAVSPALEGLFFLHDDVIWRSTSRLGGHMSFHASFQSLEHRANLTWTWIKRPSGAAAMATFRGFLNKTVDYHRGQVDEFYVASEDFSPFAVAGKGMLRAGLFLEIAVPTIFESFIPITHHVNVHLLTHWDKRRHQYMANAGTLCRNVSGSFVFAHPHKLSKIDGIISHMEC